LTHRHIGNGNSQDISSTEQQHLIMFHITTNSFVFTLMLPIKIL